MKYTIARVAKATKRSNSSIRRLVKEGKLKAELKGRSYLIDAPNGMNELQILVAKEVPYTRHVKNKNKEKEESYSLTETSKRTRLLLQIAEKFSIEELELILKL